MKVNGKAMRSIWPLAQRRGVGVIDQTRLPFSLQTIELGGAADVVVAIRSMQVRGAPLIGVTAAYGLALALREDPSDGALASASQHLAAARPTAVNLRWALDRVRTAVLALPTAERFDAAWREADRMADEDVEMNRALGAHGAALIAAEQRRRQRTVNLLTHCNAGWIACVDYGTALSAIYQAHDAGVALHVWIDETRPRNQGLLTAWELAAHGVPHTLVADNAGGHLMQRGQVDLVMVGADRVTRHGDVCNKIGTYLKAVAARDNGVPFFAAVPSPTIDWNARDAFADIPIEDRAGDELRQVTGLAEDGRPTQVAIADASTAVANPAFDVTPARLVTGIITERGVVPPAQLASLFEQPRAAA